MPSRSKSPSKKNKRQLLALLHAHKVPCSSDMRLSQLKRLARKHGLIRKSAGRPKKSSRSRSGKKSKRSRSGKKSKKSRSGKKSKRSRSGKKSRSSKKSKRSRSSKKSKKSKRKLSAYNRHVSKMMRKGHSMKEAAAAWRKMKSKSK